MGYQTQTRPLTDSVPKGRTWFQGSLWNTPSTGVPITAAGIYPTQETYSYRTGARAAGVDGNEDELLSASNQGAVFSHLKKEYQQSPQSLYDNGHEFRTIKKSVILSPVFDERWNQYGYSYRYQGPMVMDPGYTQGTWQQKSQDSVGYYGPKAINACAPNHPMLNLAVSLAELYREGFPRLGAQLSKHLLEGKSIAASLGTSSKEYLAWEFGLKPILADYQNALGVFAGYQQRLFQARRDSGKMIRRSFRFPVQRSTTVYPPSSGVVTPLAYDSTAYGAFQGSRGGIQRRNLLQSSEVWFTGAFTYFMQSDGNLIDKSKKLAQEAQLLTGFQFTPEALWNLTPWSWLSDWNVNIGTNISNATLLAQDGLVMRYGYLMNHIHSDHEISMTGPVMKSGWAPWFHTIYRYEAKYRTKASPFGFGLDPNSFTTRQKTILAALGISKASS